PPMNDSPARSSFVVILFCTILISLMPKRAEAQDYIYSIGLPPFTTALPVESGFINLSNGNLHIEIPLASQTQRGTLSLNERLVYDSRVWTIGFNASTGHNQWYPTNVS